MSWCLFDHRDGCEKKRIVYGRCNIDVAIRSASGGRSHREKLRYKTHIKPLVRFQEEMWSVDNIGYLGVMTSAAELKASSMAERSEPSASGSNSGMIFKH